MSTDWKAFLANQGAEFEGDRLRAFTGEPVARHNNAITVLPGRHFIRIEGFDAEKFLQGQISVHMTQLTEQKHRLGVACTPKGRIYSLFRILHQPSGYLLSTRSTEHAVAEYTLSTLGKYAVFFKSELSHDEEMIALALSGDGIESVLTGLNLSLPDIETAITIDGGHLLRIPGQCPRFELWIKKDCLVDWWQKLTPACHPASDELTQILDIEAVVPSLQKETIEKYIPQQLNIPSLGGVSFRKGCYTGQEIVTRMQSLGQQKNRTYRLTLRTSQNIAIDTKLFDEQGKAVGEVINAAIDPHSNSTELLANLRIEAAGTGHVYLDDAQKQPLRVEAFPYEFDTKAELQQ